MTTSSKKHSTHPTITTRRLLTVVALGLLGAAGCELAVDFDRTKIDAGAVDASISEGGGPDGIAPADASDAEVDGGRDAADAEPAADADVDAADADAVDADDGAVE